METNTTTKKKLETISLEVKNLPDDLEEHIIFYMETEQGDMGARGGNVIITDDFKKYEAPVSNTPIISLEELRECFPKFTRHWYKNNLALPVPEGYSYFNLSKGKHLFVKYGYSLTFAQLLLPKSFFRRQKEYEENLRTWEEKALQTLEVGETDDD